MIDTKSVEVARKEITRASKPAIVKAQDDAFNRKILEYGRFDVLFSVEAGERKNSLKKIDSGFNHVLADIATKNNVAIGINLEEIHELSEGEKAERLAKVRNVIETCRKSKTKLVINGNKKAGFHFLLSLGASSSQAKEATQYF